MILHFMNVKQNSKNPTQKQQRTHDLTQVLDFYLARLGFEPGTSGL